MTRHLSLAEFWFLAEHVTGRPQCSRVGSRGIHPLRDGDKRAAWACLVLFIDINDGVLNEEQPDTDDAVEAMLAVAAREVDEAWLASWLRERVTFRT